MMLSAGTEAPNMQHRVMVAPVAAWGRQLRRVPQQRRRSASDRKYRGTTFKLIPEMRDLSHKNHLRDCSLTTIEKRRLRGDQIEVFKILNGYDNINSIFLIEDRLP